MADDHVVSDGDLEDIANKAFGYRKYLQAALANGMAVQQCMLSFWAAIEVVIGGRNAIRASGMYYKLVSDSLLGDTEGPSYSFPNISLWSLVNAATTKKGKK